MRFARSGTQLARHLAALFALTACLGAVASLGLASDAGAYGFGTYRATVTGSIDFTSGVTSTRPCVEVGTASLKARFRSARTVRLNPSYASVRGKRGVRWHVGWEGLRGLPGPPVRGTVAFADAMAAPPADADCGLPARSCESAGLDRRAHVTLTGLGGKRLAIGVRDLVSRALADDVRDGARGPYCPVAGFRDFASFAGLSKDRFGSTAIRFTLDPKRLHVCSRPGRRTVLRARDVKSGTETRGPTTVTTRAAREIKLTLVKVRSHPEIAAACRRGDIRYPWERRKRG